MVSSDGLADFRFGIIEVTEDPGADRTGHNTGRRGLLIDTWG
jgi:hypothetical protein